MELHGTINHVALTVSDLDTAMEFFSPVLQALGYTIGHPMDHGDLRLTVNVHELHGTAINIWQATRRHEFHMYEPGLHHLAFNVRSEQEVDRVHEIAVAAGARTLDGPGEFPFAFKGYYAVYFLGPDKIKFEIVHMAGLETAIASGEASRA